MKQEEKYDAEKKRNESINAIKNDLNTLREELGQNMKTEMQEIIESKQATIRQMDKKLEEMRKMVQNQSMSKDEQIKFMESLDNKQETNLVALRSHIDESIKEHE